MTAWSPDRTPPGPVGGDVEQRAYDEVRASVRAWFTRGGRNFAGRERALSVLAAAVDEADDELDPAAHIGWTAQGVVRALRDLGALPGTTT